MPSLPPARFSCIAPLSARLACSLTSLAIPPSPEAQHAHARTDADPHTHTHTYTRTRHPTQTSRTHETRRRSFVTSSHNSRGSNPCLRTFPTVHGLLVARGCQHATCGRNRGWRCQQEVSGRRGYQYYRYCRYQEARCQARQDAVQSPYTTVVSTSLSHVLKCNKNKEGNKEGDAHRTFKVDSTLFLSSALARPSFVTAQTKRCPHPHPAGAGARHRARCIAAALRACSRGETLSPQYHEANPACRHDQRQVRRRG